MHLLTPSDQPTPKIPKECKDIVFFTLTLGCIKEKLPSGPTELDLEAGNLVIFILGRDILGIQTSYVIMFHQTFHYIFGCHPASVC